MLLLVIFINFKKSVPESEEQFSYKQWACSLVIEKWTKPVWKLKPEMQVLIIVSCFLGKTRS